MKPFLELCQDSVIEIAIRRLGRPLSEEEIQGIRRIHSPMFLEAMEQGFDWNQTTIESIEKDLAHFASQKEIFCI